MRYFVQLGLTVASATVIILVWRLTGYRGPANVIVMLLPPVGIALALNRDASRRAFMALALIGPHLVVIAVTGVLFDRLLSR